MGSGSGKQKYGAGEPGPESSDPTTRKGQPRIIHAKAKAHQPDHCFDTDAWRAPKTKGGSLSSSRPIRGPPPPPKAPRPTREEVKSDPSDVPTKWSPRKGGFSESERQAMEAHKKEKEKEKEITKRLEDAAEDRRRNSLVPPSGKEAAASPKNARLPVFHALPDLPGLPNMVPDEVAPSAMHALEDASKPKVEEPADYAVLADTADKVWKELLSRLSNSEEGVRDLFFFDEIKSAVEDAEKKIEAAERREAAAKRVIEDRKSELLAMSEQIEKASKERIGAAYNWKRGDFAIRRKMGLCELLAVHRKHSELRVEVRMISSESFASPSVLDLVPLNLGQESSVKKKLQEIEDAKQEQSKVDRETMKLQKDLKVEYQKLSDRLDKELEKHDLVESVCPEPTAPPASLGAPGGMDLAWTPADKQKIAQSVPVYPNMEDLFTAAHSLLKTPPPGVPPTPIAMHSLNNTPNLTNGTDPSVPPGGITRDMLPTPLRFRIDENPDSDEDDNPRKSPNRASPKKGPNLESTPQMQTGPEVVPEPTIVQAPQEVVEEWVAYTDAEGDTYYHNPKTGATEWTLPPGVRVRNASDPPGEEAKDSSKVPVDVAPTEPVPESIDTGSKADPVSAKNDAISSESTSVGQGSASRNGVTSTISPGSQAEAFTAPLSQAQQQAQRVERQISEWVVYHTEDGAPYYHNKLTGETQWDLPSGATACSPEEDEETEEVQDTAQSGDGQEQHQAQWAEYGQQQWVQQQQQWAEYGQQQWAQQQQQQAEQQWAQQQAEQQWAQQQQAAAQQWAHQQQAQQQQQQEQWSQYYAQYWTWFQQQQETRQQQGSREDPAPELSPPPPDASVQEQLAYAMKMIVLKEMETMVNSGSSLDERKKALKNLQIKWHPDKNPDQLEVAKSIFQMLGEKKEWFLQDKDAEPDLLLSVDAVD